MLPRHGPCSWGKRQSSTEINNSTGSSKRGQSGVIKVVVTSYLHFRSIPLELIPTEKTISFRKKENVNDDVNLLIQDLSYVHYPVIKTTLVDNG